MSKFYEHDCDLCVYLGSIVRIAEGGSMAYDLYFHRTDTENEDNSTLVARFGSYGDYISANIQTLKVHGANHPAIAYALSTAIIEALIPASLIKHY